MQSVEQKPSSERRKKWSVLNPTPLQKALIEEHARKAEMRVGEYILARALRTQPSARRDWRELVAKLSYLNNQLEQIALHLRDHADPIDGLRITLALRRIERATFEASMPWSECFDR